MKLGKYGESIGIWSLKVGDKIFELHPKKGDNYRLRNLLVESKKTGDEISFLDRFDDFVKGMIERDYPPANDSEKDELDLFIDYNENNLLNETLIAFRWTTKEEVEKMKNQVNQKKNEFPINLERKNLGVNY